MKTLHYSKFAYVATVCFLLSMTMLYAQVPSISFTTPQIYRHLLGQVKAPTNTEGAMPVLMQGVVKNLAGSTISGSTDATGTSASFFRPYDVTTDGFGNLYVADYSNNKIRKIVIATGVVTTFAGSGANGSVDNAAGTLAQFRGPGGICYFAGNLYVSETNGSKIRKIVVSTSAVSTFAGSTMGFSDNAIGRLAKFSAPFGITSDGSGNLYVADMSNNRIRKINISTTAVSTIAGGAGGFADATKGTSAQFRDPWGITYDGIGNLYVADNSNNRIRKINISTTAVTTVAGNGTTNYKSIDGNGNAASFYSPVGVTYDGAGNLYVSDYTCIRKIVVATGDVTTLTGNTYSNGSSNGDIKVATYNRPVGLTCVGVDKIYVTEYNNHMIRFILLSGSTISPTQSVGLTLDLTTASASAHPLVIFRKPVTAVKKLMM